MKTPSAWSALAIVLCWPAVELGILIHRAQAPAVDAGAIVHQARRPAELADAAMNWWLDCHKNAACITSQVEGTLGSIKTSSGHSVEASKELVKTLQDIHPRADAVLDETAATLHAATELENAMRRDADALSQSAGATLQPLQASLASIARLTLTLDEQVAAGAPAALQTVSDLDAAVKQFGALLADPALTATLANVEATSGHLAGAAESVDTALRPWRKRAGMLKLIVSKALSLIKLTFPLR